MPSMPLAPAEMRSSLAHPHPTSVPVDRCRCSVLTNALTDDGPIGRASRIELERDAHWAAPERLLVETFS